MTPKLEIIGLVVHGLNGIRTVHYVLSVLAMLTVRRKMDQKASSEPALSSETESFELNSSPATTKHFVYYLRSQRLFAMGHFT